MKKRKNNEIQYVKGDPAVEAGMFNDMMGNGSMTEEVEDRYVDLSGMSEYNIKNEVKSSSSQTTPDKDKKSFNFANTIDRKAKILKETDKAYLLLINYKRWNKERTGKDDYSIIAWVSKHPFGKNGKITLKPIQENIKEGYQDRTTIGKRKPTITLNSKDDKSINEGTKIKSRGVRASLNEYWELNEVKGQDEYWTEEGRNHIKLAKELGLYKWYDAMSGTFMFNQEDANANYQKIKQWLETDGNEYYGLVSELAKPYDCGETYGVKNYFGTKPNARAFFLTSIWDGGYEDNKYQKILIMPKKKYEENLKEDKIPASVRKLIDIINGKGNECEIKNGKLIVRNRDSRVGNTSFNITKEQERKLKELGYLNESLNEDKQETFTSKEANELSKEFRDYLYNLDIPKYYDVRAEKVNDGEYIIRVNIEYGDLVHDHKYLDDVAKKFFNDKGINIMIYEPSELKSEIDEDNIYSSSHIIQKSGNKIYQVKKDDDFLEEEE